MSRVKVNNFEPYSGTKLYITGTVSASAGFDAPTGYISGSVGKFTTAYIGTLDVDVINSATTTETTLEVTDKLIIAASGSTSNATLTGAGYQIGGYNTTTYPLASMLYGGNALSINVTGSTSAVMYLSGSGNIGIGTTSPAAKLDVAGHVFPSTDESYDLGSSTKRWRNIYTGDLHLRNERGDWTIVEEEDFLCVINNKTGKKYEMLLKPIED